MKLRHLPALRKEFGSAWLTRRALYALKLRAGVLRRRLPAQTWSEASYGLLQESRLESADALYEHRRSGVSPFFFSPALRHEYAPLLRAYDDVTTDPVVRADEIVSGRFRFFEHQDVDCSFPPDWHLNHLQQTRSPVDRHWSELGDFERGDIKLTWELSRFGYAFTLVRAYWRNGDEKYADAFWTLVEDWRDRNPPQQGVNWKCGQEASFRAMSWCFGLYGFLDASATTPERVLRLVEMLGTTAKRIAANIDYAIAQANNHGISEATGLWTLGTLFPELRQAAKWERVGRRILESEAERLIYSDGAFSQHSVNYHRVMLHDYVWALRLAELHGKPFSDGLRRRVAAAVEFLYQLQDEQTGAVPYYGPNDGALVLPLNNCDYHDFRPVIGSARYLSDRTRAFPDGRWAEDLLWLFGRESLESRIDVRPRHDLQAEQGGYYTLRSPDGFIFMRCGKLRHRPGQADMLHVDVWWHGQNIALDAGTFSYNSAEPWASEFAGTAAHNTLTVDGRDQMERAGKFLWLPWITGGIRIHCRDGELAYLEGEHDGYSSSEPPVLYRRGIVQLSSSAWFVLDAVESTASHLYRLHWLLGDFPHFSGHRAAEVRLETPAGPYYTAFGASSGEVEHSIARADAATARGWRAAFYNSRQPAVSVAVKQSVASTVLWTLFSPEQCNVHFGEDTIQIAGVSAAFEIRWSPVQTGPLVRAVRSGTHELIVPQ